MALVVATALAFAATRHWWSEHFDEFRPGGNAYQENFVNFMYRVRYLLYSASYFAAAWSLALLALRLRRPRPRLRRLTRQPGMVAGAAAAVVLSIRMVNIGIMLGVYAAWVPETPVLAVLENYGELPYIPAEVGCAVAAAWVVQGLSGRWHAEPSWLDRAGRALGFFWIAMIPPSWFTWIT
jgi:hypothetical protein